MGMAISFFDCVPTWRAKVQYTMAFRRRGSDASLVFSPLPARAWEVLAPIGSCRDDKEVSDLRDPF